MKEINGNLWDFHKDNWIVITTNGFVKKNGQCVMGRGTALQAAKKYPEIQLELGNIIKRFGNHVYPFNKYKIFSFPVKHNWNENADINLIKTSLVELEKFVNNMGENKIYLPRPGCGNGNLDWDDVRPILELYLDDRFTVVNI